MTDTLTERFRDTLLKSSDTLDQQPDANDVLVAPHPDQVDPDYALRGPLGAGGMAALRRVERVPP